MTEVLGNIKKNTLEDIRAITEGLLIESNQVGLYPVDLFKILEGKDISVKFFEPDDRTKLISGAYNHKSRTIYVNSTHSNGRKQFTLAHELGHAILHKDEDNVDYRGDKKINSQKELEADDFAGELLMPLEDYVALYFSLNKDFEKLGKAFGVSAAAAYTRASNLGLS